MARLPTAENLGVRTFQDRSSVVTPTADTRGQNALVSTISNISSGMTERLDASSLHKAKIHFQKAKLEADAAFDQDPDFETYQSRYDEKMKSVMEESAKLVRNPRDRERFGRDMSLYTAEGSQRMIAKAFSKEVDRGLADLNETTTIARENYLRASTKQDKQFAIDTANEAINAAEQATHIDRNQAQAMRQKLAVDIAIAAVEVAPPEKQLTLLKSKEGIFNNIPLDVRTKMIKSAETQRDSAKALEISEKIRTEGGTLTERRKKLEGIKDPEIHAAALSQVVSTFNLEQLEDGRAKYEIFDAAGKDIINSDNPAMALHDLKMTEEWEKLGLKEQLDLNNLASKPKARETNFAVYNELNRLKNEDMVEAEKFFLDNVSLFSDAEARKQSDLFAKKAVEPKPLRDIKDVFGARVKPLNLGEEDSGKAWLRLEEEYATWAKANPGKEMDAKTQADTVNFLFDKVASEHWYTKDIPVYKAPKDKAIELRLQKEFDRFASERNGGNPPSERQKYDIYNVMVQEGLLPRGTN